MCVHDGLLARIESIGLVSARKGVVIAKLQ